jgi:hypothetical protein
MIQVLYRLGWISGLSVAVLLIGYLTVGINIVTAVGLLVAYFVGLLMHAKYSPSPITHKEEHELVALNNGLRYEIIAIEKQHGDVLCALLEATDLLQQARSMGFTLGSDTPTPTDNKELVINHYQIDGNGLYQYLDAMNLLMENDDRLERLINTSV